MPIGPSHGSRGGGGSFGGGSRGRGSYGGGSRRSGSSNDGGNFLGSLVGGMIGGMLTAGARRRYRNRYNGGGGSYETEPATPSRRKPLGFLVLAIITLMSIFVTNLVP